MPDFTLQYLDGLPKIPNELVPEIYQSLNEKNFFVERTATTYTIHPSLPNANLYTRNLLYKYTNDEKWLDKTQSTIAVQKLIPGPSRIHADVYRELAYNYIVDCGGDAVATCFYNDDRSPLVEHIIQPHRWHLLNVDVLHNVKNITGTRIAITAFINADNRSQLSRNFPELFAGQASDTGMNVSGK